MPKFLKDNPLVSMQKGVVPDTTLASIALSTLGGKTYSDIAFIENTTKTFYVCRSSETGYQSGDYATLWQALEDATTLAIKANRGIYIRIRASHIIDYSVSYGEADFTGVIVTGISDTTINTITIDVAGIPNGGDIFCFARNSVAPEFRNIAFNVIRSVGANIANVLLHIAEGSCFNWRRGWSGGWINGIGAQCNNLVNNGVVADLNSTILIQNGYQFSDTVVNTLFADWNGQIIANCGTITTSSTALNVSHDSSLRAESCMLTGADNHVVYSWASHVYLWGSTINTTKAGGALIRADGNSSIFARGVTFNSSKISAVLDFFEGTNVDLWGAIGNGAKVNIDDTSRIQSIGVGFIGEMGPNNQLEMLNFNIAHAAGLNTLYGTADALLNFNEVVKTLRGRRFYIGRYWSDLPVGLKDTGAFFFCVAEGDGWHTKLTMWQYSADGSDLRQWEKWIASQNASSTAWKATVDIKGNAVTSYLTTPKILFMYLTNDYTHPGDAWYKLPMTYIGSDSLGGTADGSGGYTVPLSGYYRAMFNGYSPTPPPTVGMRYVIGGGIDGTVTGISGSVGGLVDTPLVGYSKILRMNAGQVFAFYAYFSWQAVLYRAAVGSHAVMGTLEYIGAF